MSFMCVHICIYIYIYTHTDMYMHIVLKHRLNIYKGHSQGFPGGAVVKNPPARRHKRLGLDPWLRKISWSQKCQPTPVFLSGKFQGQRKLVNYSPWNHKESDMTECTHTHGHSQAHALPS